MVGKKQLELMPNSADNGKEKISEGDNIGVNLRDKLVNEAFMGDFVDDIIVLLWEGFNNNNNNNNNIF